MSTQAVILYQARTQPTRNPGWRRWLAHDNPWSLFRADFEGAVLEDIRWQEPFPDKGGNGEFKGHGTSRGPVGRGFFLNEAHVAFGINGQDSTEVET
ncbi:uncharacterized protein G6M90_00g004110 [Metarhizium brunneum]|uniref:Uncharacterized protein n=1 Tax=Metarhizium brunneum TaxID=500148 RepID=A0A7D5UPW0_9HYPO|nr:hypothetical protein G6M90_00g004110 [Metarhizium brunneum]